MKRDPVGDLRAYLEREAGLRATAEPPKEKRHFGNCAYKIEVTILDPDMPLEALSDLLLEIQEVLSAEGSSRRIAKRVSQRG